MSVELKQLPCEHCKPNCVGMDLYVDTVKLQSTSDGKIVDTINLLCCRNEKLCKYLKKQGKDA